MTQLGTREFRSLQSTINNLKLDPFLASVVIPDNGNQWEVAVYRLTGLKVATPALKCQCEMSWNLDAR